MKLEMLGTGGYHPNETRHTPCFLMPEPGICFDAGTSAFRLPAAVTRPDLHLFLTHPHWDHIIGLTYLLVPMMLEQITSVDIYGNRHTLDAVKSLLFAEPTFSHMPAFTFHELEDYPAEITIDACRVSWMPLVSHPGGSTAYRVDSDSAHFAYVTDTYVDGSYNSFLAGTEVLLHECYFDDDMQDWAEKTGHSFLSQTIDLARLTQVNKLLLTHMDPRIDKQDPFDLTAVRQHFDRVEFAHDQQTVDLSAF